MKLFERKLNPEESWIALHDASGTKMLNILEFRNERHVEIYYLDQAKRGSATWEVSGYFTIVYIMNVFVLKMPYMRCVSCNVTVQAFGIDRKRCKLNFGAGSRLIIHGFEVHEMWKVFTIKRCTHEPAQRVDELVRNVSWYWISHFGHNSIWRMSRCGCAS